MLGEGCEKTTTKRNNYLHLTFLLFLLEKITISSKLAMSHRYFYSMCLSPAVQFKIKCTRYVPFQLLNCDCACVMAKEVRGLWGTHLLKVIAQKEIGLFACI
jgi:hypothetical protein